MHGEEEDDVHVVAAPIHVATLRSTLLRRTGDGRGVAFGCPPFARDRTRAHAKNAAAAARRFFRCFTFCPFRYAAFLFFFFFFSVCLPAARPAPRRTHARAYRAVARHRFATARRRRRRRRFSATGPPLRDVFHGFPRPPTVGPSLATSRPSSAPGTRLRARTAGGVDRVLSCRRKRPFGPRETTGCRLPGRFPPSSSTDPGRHANNVSTFTCSFVFVLFLFLLIRILVSAFRHIDLFFE